MPRPAWPLRNVDTARLAHEAAYRRCVALGWPVAWAPLPAQGTLLRFRQSGPQGEVTSLVPTADWVARHWPSLPGLAWDALDDASARGLFDIADGGPLEAPWWRDGQSRWLQHIKGDLQALPPELPCVQTDTGRVWIEQLHTTQMSSVPADLPRHLRLSVDYRLAQCALRVAQLGALQVGDVLLLEALSPVALMDRQALFSFALNEGHIMVIDFDSALPTFDNAPVARPEPVAAPTLALDKLSVTVDVVLCRMTQSLATLSEVQPGSTIALPDDAHRTIELRVQGQLLATGELVSVGEGFGVQILSRADRA